MCDHEDRIETTRPPVRGAATRIARRRFRGLLERQGSLRFPMSAIAPTSAPPVAGISAVSWLGELWRYRELFFFLAWRDVKIRYRQTALGVAWAVLQPFLQMLFFVVLFGRIVKVPTDGIPYPLFFYAAL